MPASVVMPGTLSILSGDTCYKGLNLNQCVSKQYSCEGMAQSKPRIKSSLESVEKLDN